MTITSQCCLCRVQGRCRSFAVLSGLSSLSGHFSASWLTNHSKNKNGKKNRKKSFLAPKAGEPVDKQTNRHFQGMRDAGVHTAGIIADKSVSYTVMIRCVGQQAKLRVATVMYVS